jgi:hypothetical protein
MANIDSELSALQACQSAAKKYESLITANIAIAQYNSDQATKAGLAHVKWAAAKQANQDLFNQWQNKEGIFSKFKGVDQNNSFYSTVCWSRPATGVCTDNLPASNDTDWQCSNDASNQKLPYASEYKTASGRQGCAIGDFFDGCTGRSDNGYSRGQRWECLRPQTAVDNDTQDYNNAKPAPFTDTEPLADVGDYAYKVPVATNSTDIQCCNNIMSDVTNASNTVQSCNQVIDQKIQAITSSIPVASAQSTLPPPDNTSSIPVASVASGFSSNKILVIILLVGMWLAMLSSLLGIYYY